MDSTCENIMNYRLGLAFIGNVVYLADSINLNVTIKPYQMTNFKQPLPRRTFLGNLSKAGLLSALGLAPAAVKAGVTAAGRQEPETEAHMFLCKPYLQCPGPTSMTVRCVTSRPSYTWVEYGENGQLDRKAQMVNNGLVAANNRIHSIQLKDLQPGKQYSYKVLSKEINDFQPYQLTYGNTIESGIHTFATPDDRARSVSWLIMNDIHDRPHSIPHLMNLNGNDAYDFVFFNGDMFDYQTNEQQIIDHMLTPCADSFASGVPFMYVRGNHETRGAFARELRSYFDNPGEGHYFSFTRGPVHAIVLDTGEDKEDSHPVYAGIVDFDAYRRQQAVWLQQEMQTPAFKKAKFRVVMMHIPHYHSGDWHGPMHCRAMFGELFNRHQIDLFVAGHTHRYGVFDPQPGEHHYPIIIGGGPKEGNRTLIKVKADMQQLQLTMLRDDGEKVGEYHLKSKR